MSDGPEFRLPSLLNELIESGIWPTSTPNMQELKPLLGKDAARQVSPDDDYIVLQTPPFHTIGDEVRGGNGFWLSGVSNPNEIDYNRALIIADFGLGSDSPIILYYDTEDSPRVMYLCWIINGQDIRHRWIETHTTFDQFATAVGLDRVPAEQTDEREPE